MRDLSEKYFPLIKKFKQSGMTVDQYCWQNSINTKTFYYWKKKYDASEANGFISLAVLDAGGGKALTIEYADGTRLIFGEAVKVSFIKELLPAFCQ
jgi:hypothetical protein